MVPWKEPTLFFQAGANQGMVGTTRELLLHNYHLTLIVPLTLTLTG